MFLGRFNHTVDEKGRLAIPARYRILKGEELRRAARDVGERMLAAANNGAPNP